MSDTETCVPIQGDRLGGGYAAWDGTHLDDGGDDRLIAVSPKEERCVNEANEACEGGGAEDDDEARFERTCESDAMKQTDGDDDEEGVCREVGCRSRGAVRSG